jgi:hypothetical protein
MNQRQLIQLRIAVTAAIAGTLTQAKVHRESPVAAARLTKELVDAHVLVNRAKRTKA